VWDRGEEQGEWKKGRECRVWEGRESKTATCEKMPPDPYAQINPIDVLAAAKRLDGITTRTPLRRSDKLSDIAGTDVWLKLECMQVTGSFKARGAYNALAQLGPDERARGVVAASAGNHGMGVAWAGRALGIKARVFVPADAPKRKREGIESLGAEIDTTGDGYDDAHARAIAFAESTGAVYVDPCSTAPIFAGQGTVALEILTAMPEVGAIVLPFGGGGLAAGVADFTRAVAPAVSIVGVQSEHTNAIARSLDAGRVVPIPGHPTVADGLAGQADEGALSLARRSLDHMVVVTEDSLGAAMAWLIREEGITTEGAGAVGVAAILSRQLPSVLRPPVVLVISGGNVDESRVTSLLERYRDEPLSLSSTPSD
jgi:threonine dehydratase